MTWHPDMPEEYRNQIVIGDARELAERIPDESVDLIFTDPVYDRIDDYRWLAETAVRVLKVGSSLLCYIAHHREIQIGKVISGSGLFECPVLQEEIYSRIPGRLFQFNLQCNLRPILWFSKGDPTNKWMYIQASNSMTARPHKWGKAYPAIGYRIDKFTQLDAIVLDPFTGGGTVPAVCKMLGRNYIAFEIDPDVAEMARERVLNTQPPLFVLEPEQLGLTL